MAYFLKTYDHLDVGPTAALNFVAACNLAKVLGPGHTIVTIITDAGERYRSKLGNIEFLRKQGLEPSKYLESPNKLTFLKELDKDKNMVQL